MIILTGGAGFIGSCFLWKLNSKGLTDVLVVDHLDESGKWRNLAGKHFRDYMQKDDFIRLVQEDRFPRPDAVIHLGACSSTTLTDAGYFIRNNYEYSKILAQWAMRHKVYFMYASSAATYGDGGEGYSDSDQVTPSLRPLNMYGFSKHLFDMWVLNNALSSKVTGLKFFNVFGPNEYHKSDMRSVVCKAFQTVHGEGRMDLFRSYKEEYGHGEQKRDFIYVKDAVDIMYRLFEDRDKKGIFNIGTGKAHTWNELAAAIFTAVGKEPAIRYIDMPEGLRGKYQYFTEADMSKLKATGLTLRYTPLAEAVKDYVWYLKSGQYL